MRQTRSERAFAVFNHIILALISFLTLYPFWYVLVASFSSAEDVIGGNVWFVPLKFTLAAYEKVVNQKGIWIAYGNTIAYTGLGTLVSIFLTVCGAYPLSKERLRGKTAISFIVALTMWFNAGMIPVYLNLKSLGLVNNRLAMIIAFACTAFYVILLRTYFQSIPVSMEESAKIDGANDLLILLKIYLPLSVPALATITLYYAVNKWNEFFWAMVLLTDENKIPLQVLLRKMIVDLKPSETIPGIDIATNYSEETIRYATIVVATIPMLILYPYIQKHFVRGIMIGAIKG